MNSVNCFYTCLLASVLGFVVFYANIIPFAMDQLRDAPTQESKKFIYWYVLIDAATFFLRWVSLILQPFYVYSTATVVIIYTINISVAVMTFLCLVVSLLISFWKKLLFNVEPSTQNPYSLVYKVTKFALYHKIPLNRSAFTYCEDELPSRLDLGGISTSCKRL